MTDDKYGKDLVRRAVGDAFVANVKIDYGRDSPKRKHHPPHRRKSRRVDRGRNSGRLVEGSTRRDFRPPQQRKRYPAKLLIVIDPPNGGGFAARSEGIANASSKDSCLVSSSGSFCFTATTA